jgi:NADP-dependent 3-hydroxy acid dehydrogenase YdfG
MRLPHLREQGGGRIVQVSAYGGQATLPAPCLYHTSEWGIEGFIESTMQDVAPFKYRRHHRRAGRRTHGVQVRKRQARSEDGRL